MSETALAVVPTNGNGHEKEGAASLMRRASDVAGVCREIVLRTAMELQGKRYVKVEGWQSIAAAYGCIPSIREVVEEERGVRAIAELRRHDGAVLATAEGYCGLDEPRWATQPMYARRGMASTRAISRVCRSAFAFCVVLIDGNLSTTPAEEIPQGGDVVDVQPVAPRPSPPRQSASSAGPERSAKTRVRFGKSKGKFLCELEADDLAWQRAAAQKSVDANDPKWHNANVEWLSYVDAELKRRQG